MNLEGHFQSRVEFATLPEQRPQRVLQLIIQTIDQLTTSAQMTKGKLGGIGISCGGPLDRLNGLIQTPPNLPTWIDVPITSILQRDFGVDCRLENDANAGAVAEHRFGAGQGTSHMTFLTMGTGMGAGIIADGRLYHGCSNLAGEIGHVRLSQEGQIGYNKAGSVEGWASGGGIAQLASKEAAASIENGQPTYLTKNYHERGTLTAKDVAEAAQRDDELEKRILHQTGCRLGEALAILMGVLNPERIVIGGLAMRHGEGLLALARTVMQQEALSASVGDCQIVPAALGEKIGNVAAVCVAMGF